MKAALLLVLAALPSAVLACPSCVRDTTPGAWLLVAGLIAAPYLVVAGVVKAVHSADAGADPGGDS